MKLHFEAVGKIEALQLKVNRKLALRRGLPRLGATPPLFPSLAVVGGGPSAAEHLDEIRRFQGDIWAINGAWWWLKERGIASTFFTIDADPATADWIRGRGVSSAVVSSLCDHALFEALGGAEIEVWDLMLQVLSCGPTSASNSTVGALLGGYKKAVYYGCESSYTEAPTHAYGDKKLISLVQIEVNGERFVTSPDMLMQAEYLSGMIRELPETFSEKSGGLLRAFIGQPDYEVVAVSEDMVPNLGKGLVPGLEDAEPKAREEHKMVVL